MDDALARWLARASAAGWAGRSWWRAHQALRTRRLADIVLPAPRRPGRGRGSVLATLRLLRASCLERALVVQGWDAAAGSPRDVVVGVSRADGRTRAHAWLDGEDPRGDFVVIHRRPAVAPGDDHGASESGGDRDGAGSGGSDGPNAGRWSRWVRRIGPVRPTGRVAA